MRSRIHRESDGCDRSAHGDGRRRSGRAQLSRFDGENEDK